MINIELARIIYIISAVLGVLFTIISFGQLSVKKKSYQTEIKEDKENYDYQDGKMEIVRGIISMVVTVISIAVGLGFVEPSIQETEEKVTNNNEMVSVTNESSTTTSTTTTTTTTTTMTTTTTTKSFSGNITFDFSQTDKDSYQYQYSPTVTGMYGFVMDIDSVNNNYKLVITNSKDEEVASGYYDDKDSHTIAAKLVKDQTYNIEVVRVSGYPQGSIVIKKSM